MTLNYGVFLNAFFNFLIVGVGDLPARQGHEPDAPRGSGGPDRGHPSPSAQEALLAEIRDLLKPRALSQSRPGWQKREPSSAPVRSVPHDFGY